MSNRREFLKIAGLAGIGLGSAGALQAAAGDKQAGPAGGSHPSGFNMTGFAAPKLETVRVANIGIGNRGGAALGRMLRIAGAEQRAICDVLPERVNAAVARLGSNPRFKPQTYSGGLEEWKKVCDRDDIDLVYITTPWKFHAPMAVYAMEHGKHAVMEVPAALTVDECWQLVETSERTRRHCMMLANCCYDFFEMLTLNMARQGFFGEIVHGECGYLHTFTFNPQNKTRTWRMEENLVRNGNLYPTHGMGPVCQIMDINCGDKMDFLVSVSGADFMMKHEFNRAAANDEFWKPYAEQAAKTHRGNMNVTTIRTNRGRTIMLQHDITSPRPYSRLHHISGTKAIAQKYPEPPRIAVNHDKWLPAAEFKALEDKFTPELTKRVGEMAKKVGGHGGMDFLMDWRLIDCLRNGLPLDVSVYDSAAWTVVGPLSEWSVAHRSNSIDVPDFTRGAWKTNPRGMDLGLLRGGNTKSA